MPSTNAQEEGNPPSKYKFSATRTKRLSRTYRPSNAQTHHLWKPRKDRAVNTKQSKNYAEVILGLVLGIVSIVLGSLFIVRTCNLIFPTSPNSPACYDSASNLYGLVGLILAPLGVLAVVASMAVLMGRKHV
jgi:hypothetical protein